MNRIECFKEALNVCNKTLVAKPYMLPLRWIINQLEYLISLELNYTADTGMLKDIKIGWITARELDGFEDKYLINLLYLASAEAERMAQERGLNYDK